MPWIREHWIVLLLLVLYTAVMVHHALVGKRRTHGMVDYYIGGRSLGGLALGLSFFATYASTNSFVGFSGQAYTYGVAWLLMAPCVVLFSWIAWVWIAPRLRRFTAALDSVTIPDFIGFRFDSKAARVLAALIVLFASFLYMTAIFKGIGNLLETFLDLPYRLAILIVFVIVVIYTAVGGFISVVRTDVVQGVVMFFAAIFLFTGTVDAAGGLGSFFEVRSQPGGAALFAWDTAMPFLMLLGIMIPTTMKFMVEPRQLSRFYALRDQRETRKGMLVSTGLFFIVFAMLVPIGIYAHRILPAGSVLDSDLVVPMLLSEGAVFHPAIAAFLLVAMIAAAMSSLDSVLLVMASTCHRDLVSMWRPSFADRAAVRATRIYVGLFAFITALIALNPPGGIVTLTAFSGSLYAACFLPSIVLGLYWRRGNGQAAIASFIVGIAVLVLWKYLPWAAGIHQVFPAMLSSMLAYAALSYRGASNDAPSITRLFTKEVLE